MPEKQNIEWKEIWKDEYLAWICGFANAQGGTLYIGKNDKGEIVKLSNARKLLEDLPNKIRDAMGIIVPVDLIPEGDKEYIEISVRPYPIAISYKGIYYYRSGSTNQRLTGLELESFLLRKQGATWDNLPLPAFTIKDVDDDVIMRFKKWAAKKGRIEESALDEPKEVLMKKLHLMNNGYLTNAAMLLFANDPEMWQLGAFTKIGFFESWGRGIEKICQACREDNVPLPEYDITGNSVMIKFIAPEDRIVYGPSKSGTVKGTVKGTVNGTVTFTEKEHQILELLFEDPAYTYQEIADRLNIGRKAVFGRIKRLKEKGLLERVGSDKSGHWKIRL